MVGLATAVPLRFVDGDHVYAYLPEPPVAAGEQPNVIVEPTGSQYV